jgi:allantoicase
LLDNKCVIIVISVTIKLGSSGSIFGIDIDTTGYEQCAPLKATVHGYLKETEEVIDVQLIHFTL